MLLAQSIRKEHFSHARMSQSHVDIDRFDLNLLRILDVLLRTRGVTRAAAELGLTQSGVSRALQRLRVSFDDQLLVRDGRHMRLTAVAEQLRAPIGRILDDSRLLFVSGRGFDASTAQWAVRIGSAGYVEHVLLPHLMMQVQREAPGIDVQLLSNRWRDPDLLTEGRVDFLIDVAGAISGPGLITSRLFSDEFCCVVRRDHPVVDAGLSLARFTELDHVLVAPGGQPGGMVDEVLARRGLRRRVRLQVSTFSSPIPLVSQSDAIATVPRRIAAALASRWPVTLLEPPLTLEGFTVNVYWSAHRRTEAAHRWFRGLLQKSALSLG